MSKIKDFYEGLKKSTKITVLSCGSFVVMTMLILAFFIIFPITPSEKIMTNIGRENMARDNGQQTVQSTQASPSRLQQARASCGTDVSPQAVSPDIPRP